MAYRTNPFLERMSERTASDQEFVRLFSPKILERLPDDVFKGAVYVFRSPPGGGKTTLLRALTPTALRAFWHARKSSDMGDAFQRLVARGVLNETAGPQMLGVMLSCASGYADLPPGASFTQEGLFRALLDCRIVLRALRSLALLLGLGSAEHLDNIRLVYDDNAKDLKSIPLASTAGELVRWAEQRERGVYAQLDSIAGPNDEVLPAHIRFEGVLWLQGVRFIRDGKVVETQRLLMIDDLHKLRRKQREMLIEEMTELRPSIPVWLAERSIALGTELLAQGAREGRDLREFSLNSFGTPGGVSIEFLSFAQNILDRRLDRQSAIPSGSFGQYLRTAFQAEGMTEQVSRGIALFRDETQRYRSNRQYAEWFERADRQTESASVDALWELYITRILIARNEGKRQMALELGPLPAEEIEDRDNSQVQGAAEIFMHDELNIPYYFGIERLCVMASNNVEELLNLASALYEGLQAKQVLRKELVISPSEQEKLLKDSAKRKRDFIPKTHTAGTRAQRLLDAIGAYCRKRTFLPNAPYAPGVTGIRLTHVEMVKLRGMEGPSADMRKTLHKVLSECVAENLLVSRPSAASVSREGGTVFYLNRTLCAHYGLPLQMGGWQDVKIEDLIAWMQHGPEASRNMRLQIE